jgi:hypothetical protein
MQMPDASTLFFVSHASFLLRVGERFLLTDPWYGTPAFSSWRPCPPPTLNPDVLLGLSHAGKLSVLVSHAHPDHADPAFLAALAPETPILVPAYRDGHLTKLIRRLGKTVIEEVGEGGLDHGDLRLTGFFSHLSAWDCAVAIEAPDAFIFHGNDFWRLSEAETLRLKALRPDHKVSLLAGQGGSADGYPLTYSNFTDVERLQRLNEKNERMINGLAGLANSCGFDYALAYACFTRVDVPGHDYAFQAPWPTAAHCNAITGDSRFLDLSPGDLWIPAERRLIPLLQTLHVDPRVFPVVPVTDFAVVDPKPWAAEDAAKLSGFAQGCQRWLAARGQDGGVDPRVAALAVRCDVVGAAGETVASQLLTAVSAADAIGAIRYTVPAATMRAVLDRQIPFEHLDTGYLACIHRHPADLFVQDYYSLIFDYGFAYLAGKIPVGGLPS